MKRSILLAMSVAAIAVAAGCSRGGPAQMPTGQWEMKTKLTQLELPPEAERMLGPVRAQLNREQTRPVCITSDPNSNPLRAMQTMLSRGQPGASCQTDDNVFANGAIRLRVTCRGTNGQPGEGSMSMEGHFTEDTLEATVIATGSIPGMAGPGGGAVRMTTTFHGRRLGECPAGGAARPAQGGSL